MRKKLGLIILIIIQTIIYIIVGGQKQYLHIDEAYSFGLANYDKVDIQNNEDFFNNWHTKEYYNDYLTVQQDEKFNFTPVYINQKNDVHPPLYYLLLRISMNFANEHFTKWTGIIINIIIYAFITIFMYLILEKIFVNEENAHKKTVIFTFMSSVILASLSNVIYIRMYALSTLNVLITTFLHITLLESKEKNTKLLMLLGSSVIAGILTHYYYLYYLFFMYFLFIIKYIKEKKIKTALNYTITIAGAGVISLIIFPYSIKHMFFGYRGKGVISNLSNIHEMITGIIEQLVTLNYYAFNNLMYVIVVAIILGLIYIKLRKYKIDITKETKEILKVVIIPSFLFFIMAAVSSPWNVLRYIVPVCGIIFVIVMYYLYKLIQVISGEKASNIIICLVFCIVLLSPIAFKLKPELLYDDRKEIVEELGEKYNLPTVYLFNSSKGGVIEDITLFDEIDESYIAKDIEYTAENIKGILKNKDISNGIIIFINEEEKEEKLQIVKEATGLNESKLLKELTACEVYYIK